MPAITHMHPLKIFISLCMASVICSGNRYSATGNASGSIEAVKQAREKALFFLKSIQRTDGAICDSVNPLFETWETILAVTAICRPHRDTGLLSVKKGLAFLRNNENGEGLICHNQKCKRAYCLETTAVYYSLLQLTGKDEKVIDGLKKIDSLQKPTGEWHIGNPDVTIQKDFPSVTAFVLNSFQSNNIIPLHKKEAVDWLLKKQTVNGDWGTAWEYYGCPAYAMWPVMQLLQHQNTGKAKNAKTKAIAYILAAQHKNGSWYYKDAASAKQTSAELQTALMLAALQNAGIKNNGAILKGIRFLIMKQQKNGSWDGGFFPIPEKRYSKREYVFATALAADVMHNYLLNNNN